MATHYDIVSVDSVRSTQNVASARHDATGVEVLVVANHQTQGRGRQGRTWDEPARGLFSSFALTTDWPVADRPMITLCTAVALASSIDEMAGTTCAIKWPNDLLIDGTKVAGILVEVVDDIVTVGCGVNLWWPDAPVYAGAVFDADPGGTAAMDIARGWVDRLLETLDRGPDMWPDAEYLRRSSTIGQVVTWDNGEGIATGIAPGGGLIIDTGGGETVLTAGEVHTRQGR